MVSRHSYLFNPLSGMFSNCCTLTVNYFVFVVVVVYK